MRRVTTKTPAQIAAEWDALAQLRDEQIRSGRDLSFHRILAPSILQLLGSFVRDKLLDCGCGTGQLTSLMAQFARRTVAIDLSPRSIEIASSNYAHISNIEFRVQALEELGASESACFQTAVGNMFLMDVVDLSGVAAALARSLRVGGDLIFSITHPCFWPRYAGYETKSWFHYYEECIIEAPFRISLEASQLTTTHVHRPLESYLKIFRNCGFRLDKILEPVPSSADMSYYPVPWSYPRFLIAKFLRIDDQSLP